MTENELSPLMLSHHSFGRLRSLLLIPCPIRVSVDSTESLIHDIIFLLFLLVFLDDKKCCRNCVDPRTKRAKTVIVVSAS